MEDDGIQFQLLFPVPVRYPGQYGNGTHFVWNEMQLVLEWMQLVLE